MSDYDPKLVHLPGTALSPEVVLHRTLQKLEHIESVVVMIAWKGGKFDADWSVQKTTDLTAQALLLTDLAIRNMKEGPTL